MSSSTDHPPRVDSPMAVRYIPITFDTTDPDKAALELAYELYPEWKHSAGEVEVVQFTDGITNTLSKATKKVPGQSDSQNDDGAILMRSYGQGTDVLIDRERELKAHELLASKDLAPPLLARFNNGIIYNFVQGHVCSPADLRKPHVYRATAKRIGQWHGSLPISAITSTPDINAKPELKHCGLKNGNYTRPVPNMWSVVQQWIDALPNDSEEDKKRNRTLNTELEWLSEKFGATPGLNGKDYIFSHCDLLSGNVIVQQPSGSERFEKGDTTEHPVTIIDYEYSTPGPAAFDIANHMAEWAGFECEYSGCPTKSQRRDFLRHYVTSFHYHCLPDTEDTPPKTVEIDFEKDIEQLYNQIDEFRGLPGFYWGVWGLIQAMISQIDFDYASYADSRLEEYWAWKRELDGSRVREGRELHPKEKRWMEE